MKSFKYLREELNEGLVGNLVKHKSDLKKMQAASDYHNKQGDKHADQAQAAPDNSDKEDHHYEKSYDHGVSQEHIDNAIDAHKKRNYKERDKHLDLYHRSKAAADRRIDVYRARKDAERTKSNAGRMP